VVKIKPVSKEWEKRSVKMQRNRRVYNFVLYTTSCAGMSPSKIKLQQTKFKAKRTISDSWNESRRRKKKGETKRQENQIN
jgi:hypothetical protein